MRRSAPIIEVWRNRTHLGYFVFRVRCPYGCKGGHVHGAVVGSRVPHCRDGLGFDDYVVTDPDGLLAAATERKVS